MWRATGYVSRVWSILLATLTDHTELRIQHLSKTLDIAPIMIIMIIKHELISYIAIMQILQSIRLFVYLHDLDYPHERKRESDENEDEGEKG